MQDYMMYEEHPYLNFHNEYLDSVEKLKKSYEDQCSITSFSKFLFFESRSKKSFFSILPDELNIKIASYCDKHGTHNTENREKMAESSFK